MKGLFDFDKNNEITIKPELLELEPYRKLWNRSGKDKSKVNKELAFIWYLCADTKINPYYIAEFKTDILRIETICIDIGMKVPDFDKDTTLKDCVELFKRLNYNETQDTINALRLAKISLKEFFRTYNPKAADADALSLGRNIASMQQLDKVIKDLEKNIISETDTIDKVYGGGEIGFDEEPIDE
jgi:hypothetical protein